MREAAIPTWLFLLVVLYVGLTCLTTGGPNHGEHPFLVTLVQLILFFWLASAQGPRQLALYRGLVIGALGYSLVCRVTVHTWLRYVNAALMVGLYLGCFYLLLTRRNAAAQAGAAAVH